MTIAVDWDVKHQTKQTKNNGGLGLGFNDDTSISGSVLYVCLMLGLRGSTGVFLK